MSPELPPAGRGAFTITAFATSPVTWSGSVPMTTPRRERLDRTHRLRSSREFGAVKASGTTYRGRFCVLLVLPRPGEPTRFGFITSRRTLGPAVKRNRARRRLREIVRRRFPRMPRTGYWIVVIARRGALDAPHQELASEMEQLLARAGALTPIEPAERATHTT